MTAADNEAPPADNEAPPTRGPEHDRLAVWLGEWRSEGTSYGGTEQDADPRANGVPWVSTTTGRWHTGEFFVLQDEKARPGGAVFDTLSVMGVDADTGRYFAQSFENHGFQRRYDVTVDGDTWTFSGDFERATVVFSDDNRTQTVTWEWKPGDTWLPLCDRTETRTD